MLLRDALFAALEIKTLLGGSDGETQLGIWCAACLKKLRDCVIDSKKAELRARAFSVSSHEVSII